MTSLGRDVAFFSVSDMRVVADQDAAYLVYRREHVNPGMAGMRGFRQSLLARQTSDAQALLLFNAWDAEGAWRAYQQSPIHDSLRNTIRTSLTTSMDIGRYQLVDLPNGGGLEQPAEVPEYMTVSTHRVRASETAAYLELRRAQVHPGMAGLPGFHSSSLLRNLDAEDEFLVVNQWAERTHGHAYASSPLHDDLRRRVRALLAHHSGTREFLTVPL